ncbi:hypothetical protein GBA52_008862 [Prunus armeniaca]|nr:hypothetical protein GBA52_008862 [Prunus armeniaca]
MEGEFGSFIKVWTSVFVCIFYCYSIGKIVPKGTTRFVCALPVVCLFFYLPLNFSSIHLGGGTSFFISWLGTFKLLLFAFGKGPLASDPSISIGRFLAIACLPIEIQENPSPSTSHLNGQNRKNPPQNPQIETNPSPKNTIHIIIKGFLLAILIGVLNYSQQIHPKLILVLHCLYIYLLLETQLIIVAALAWGLLGLDLKQHFNEPYLSTSLQNFWGRRWNLVVTSILRQSVYEPTLNFSTCVIGRRWASLPAVFASFLVSGLMHELIYYHMGRVRPTWEVTWFFVLHGFCLMVEIVLKKALKGRCLLPRLISVVLTVGFVVATCFWLFFPQFLRCKADVRMLQEYRAFVVFLKNAVSIFSYK